MQLRNNRKSTSPGHEPTRNKRRRSSRQQHDASTAELPPQILFVIAQQLQPRQEDLASASAVCKTWAKHIREGITHATLCVNAPGGKPDNPHARLPALTGLSKHSPALRKLQLLLSGRSAYEAVTEAMGGLQQLAGLQELSLQFVVSQTPKKGMWPMFFADNMQLGGLRRLAVEGSSMPPLAVSNLLTSLVPCKHLKQLQLLMGRPQAGSQLPRYNPPVWMQLPYHTSGPSCLTQEHLEQLCKLTGLESLALELDPAISAAAFKHITKLKGLSSLVLHGVASPPLLARLGQLRRLRRLAVTVAVSATAGWPEELQELEAVEQIDLGLHNSSTAIVVHRMSSINSHLSGLSPKLKHSLRGLTLGGGFTWCKAALACIASLTGLTSLQLLQTKADQWSGVQIDLSVLAQLKHMVKFTMQFPHDLQLQVKFTVEQQEGGSSSSGSSRRHSGGGKRGKKQQKVPSSTRDVSGLLRAWPALQSLQLSQLTPAAVADTCWDMRQLTALTSLCLQVAPSAAAVAAVAASGGSASPTFLQDVTVSLKLEQMPEGLQQLQLTGCTLQVPYYVPFCDALASLSLSHCWLQRCWDPSLSQAALPSPTAAAARTPGPSSAGSSALSYSSSMLQQQPLVVLLRQLQHLQQLELANMHHSQLNDALLAAAAAAAAPGVTSNAPAAAAAGATSSSAAALASGPGLTGSASGSSLRCLTSLSVLGIGNPGLSHGGLLGLTTLKQLRLLRWHVGDVLELMPDMGALAKLKGLVALAIPTWLHAQMERWGAYAVLDSLPLCDVHVEATA
ncbi:hypothetical protein OEZ85_012722 [Tetradesmus obliquus]|uniref:F-box domain-containing protein n=1 Tax=Tetradesmus obliquus TaxID=3088 RepID=A0ABY8U3G0_TETOB|nr:hypothetical protein OEZ85_012722 [Tetradesmus obliquus]